MSAARPAGTPADPGSGLADLVSALTGGRRGAGTPRRPVQRLRRRTARTGGAAPRAEDGGRESQEGGGRPDVGEDVPVETAGVGVGGTGDGAAGSGDLRPGGREAAGERGRPSARSAGAALDRRRAVEAQLIGLHRAPGPDPAWWEPCWERGLDAAVPPDRLFDELAGLHPGVRVLHDLNVAGTSSLIDHVLVGSGGVVVADTETCTGRVKTDGVHLRVKGRDRSPMVDVALWQAEVIRNTLELRGIRNVPVHGVLHWQHLEGLGDRAICLRGVPLLSAGATVGLAATGIDVSPLGIERITAALAPAARHH